MKKKEKNIFLRFFDFWLQFLKTKEPTETASRGDVFLDKSINKDKKPRKTPERIA
jgi:hypothetical protein